MVPVPSNTSIRGVGASGTIIHGNLVLDSSRAPVDNIVVQYKGASLDRSYRASVSVSRSPVRVALGFANEDCTAGFFDSETGSDGVAVNVKAALLARHATVTASEWRPIDAYAYTARPRAGLAATIQTNAGAGKWMT